VNEEGKEKVERSEASAETEVQIAHLKSENVDYRRSVENRHTAAFEAEQSRAQINTTIHSNEETDISKPIITQFLSVASLCPKIMNYCSTNNNSIAMLISFIT
jgi:hypothetical protein